MSWNIGKSRDGRLVCFQWTSLSLSLSSPPLSLNKVGDYNAHYIDILVMNSILGNLYSLFLAQKIVSAWVYLLALCLWRTALSVEKTLAVQLKCNDAAMVMKLSRCVNGMQTSKANAVSQVARYYALQLLEHRCSWHPVWPYTTASIHGSIIIDSRVAEWDIRDIHAIIDAAALKETHDQSQSTSWGSRGLTTKLGRGAV